MPGIRHKGGDEPVDPTVRTTAFTGIYERVYRCDATGGAFDVHLPTASGQGGKDILIYAEHDAGNTITCVPSGVETIAGAANLALNARDAVILTSNNVDDWMKFGV